MDANSLIKYIYENEKTEYVLEKIGCHHINGKSNKEWRCGLPNHTSKTAVSVKKNEYLNVRVFQSDDKILRGNILTLVMNVLDVNFPKANKIVHEYLGLEYKFKKKTKNEKQSSSPIDIFMKAKSKKNKFNIKDIEIFDEDKLQEYTPNLHRSWLSEGILSFTAREFGIGYDYKSKRIVIPHRFWSGDNDDYVGIVGRTTIKNYDLLDIPKYFPLKAYPKGVNLYGLNENYNHIQEYGYVTIHEAEKSVLKRHSRLDKTGVALMCHDITEEQIRILIGLNVDIVICMDKGIKIEHIWSLCDKFYGIRNVYYIWDKYDLIPNKEAPADMPNKIYNYLFDYKIRYDENEKRRYDKWVRENQEKN